MIYLLIQNLDLVFLLLFCNFLLDLITLSEIRMYV